MEGKLLLYTISDLSWGRLKAILGCEQPETRPEIIDDEDGTWHLYTPTKLAYTPGISKAINQLPFAIPYYDWIDYRPEGYRKHDHYYIGKFGATVYDTSEEPKRSRNLKLTEDTRHYLVTVAQSLQIKSLGKRTSDTSLCSATLEAIGLMSIRPNIGHPEQPRSLADMLKEIKLPKDSHPYQYPSPKELARQALINVGVDPDLIDRYASLKDAPIIKDNTPD